MIKMKLNKNGDQILEEIIRTSVPSNGIALWSLGQEGFLIKYADTTFLFDPYFSASELRKFVSPLLPEQCEDIDFVICTHHHEDHMDPITLQGMRHFTKTKFVIPRAHLHLMKEWGFHDNQLIGISHLETLRLGEFEISAFAGKHETFELNEQGEHLYLGYVLRAGEVVLYHAGDTIGFLELREWLLKQKVDVALIPINGRDFMRNEMEIRGNCNYREAADLAVSIQADMLIPMHFGLFPHNDENPAYLVDYLYSRYPLQKFHMMVPCERYIYMK